MSEIGILLILILIITIKMNFLDARATGTPTTMQIGMYKIFVYFTAFLHGSIILLLPLPTCNAHTIAILLG